MRIGHDGITHNSAPGGGVKNVQKIVHKKNTFISAADIFNTLPKEQQQALKEWFNRPGMGVEKIQGQPWTF